MKAKEKSEKEQIKLKFAVGLAKALNETKFKSFRDLALHTGFETSHIQKIAAGKVDVVITTCIALAEGLGISYTRFSSYYDNVTEKEIDNFLKDQQNRKRKTQGTKKITSKKKKF